MHLGSALRYAKDPMSIRIKLSVCAYNWNASLPHPDKNGCDKNTNCQKGENTPGD